MSKKPKDKPETVPATVDAAPSTLLGRPTLYSPEYTHAVRVLCERGATDHDLADFFEVTVRTINRWKLTHPEFADAIRKGKEPADNRVEDSLYSRAQDREVEEEQAFKVKKITYADNGKKLTEEEKIEIVKVKKFVPASDTAMIFWLKNRRKDEWRDIQKHEHGKAGDFDQMSEDELLSTIAKETKELAEMDPAFAAQLRAKRATKH